MAKGDELVNMTQPTKKKQQDDNEQFGSDIHKPLQLQRRRVWRACESCRCDPSPLLRTYLTNHQAQEDQVRW